MPVVRQRADRLKSFNATGLVDCDFRPRRNNLNLVVSKYVAVAMRCDVCPHVEVAAGCANAGDDVRRNALWYFTTAARNTGGEPPTKMA